MYQFQIYNIKNFNKNKMINLIKMKSKGQNKELLKVKNREVIYFLLLKVLLIIRLQKQFMN